MANQFVFKRYELKYLLTKAQKAAVLEAMAEHMALDDYGRTDICNVYYDTDRSLLIRRSIEKPAYKEKLRVRSYRQVSGADKVFVELKKKHDSIVYKRRMAVSCQQAEQWLNHGGNPPAQTQISREIQYFLDYYQTIHPAVYLCYQREAYYALDGGDFRVTFDDNIRYRRHDLTLQAAPGGKALLGEDQVLMEVKCSGGLPLWMVAVLSREKIYKTSYSKYGAAYQQMLAEKINGGLNYA